MNEFKREMAGVAKLETAPRIDVTHRERRPTAAQLAAREHAVRAASPNYLRDFLDESNHVLPDHEFLWNRDGTQVAVLSRLKLGLYQSDDQLDLHHKLIREAHGLIWSFLSKALENGYRNVRIIHGKGAKSQPPARLKSFVGQVLQEHQDVFAFCSAPQELGGSGTTLVWLRKSQRDKEATRERIQSKSG